MRDYQRSRVYAWEEAVIAKRDNTTVTFEQARNMVAVIWDAEGLRYPPKVERLAPPARRLIGHATRHEIRLSPRTPSWCILHEMAHSMTSDIDGQTVGHGPVFMGVYASLLLRYLRVPTDLLHESLKSFRVDVEFDARPTIAD